MVISCLTCLHVQVIEHNITNYLPVFQPHKMLHRKCEPETDFALLAGACMHCTCILHCRCAGLLPAHNLARLM